MQQRAQAHFFNGVCIHKITQGRKLFQAALKNFEGLTVSLCSIGMLMSLKVIVQIVFPET